MPSRIEDYAAIGNCETMALVGRDGSIDWLCLPRFDSGACFAALLGDVDNGRWLIAPEAGGAAARRGYRDGSMVLETVFETAEGSVALIDFMARHDGRSDLVRIVRGLKGRLAMKTELVVRFDYGSVIPWVSKQKDGRLDAVAGPDRLQIAASVPLRGEDMRTVGEFELAEGEEAHFVISWAPSYRDVPKQPDACDLLARVEADWERWVGQCRAKGPWAAQVTRSLITLKGLTHWETGGVLAAATTSLPEQAGGTRNWDYRYCWLRDASFSLFAMMQAGFLDEAKAWRKWLLRAVAGSPERVQIMYGLAGERMLIERELPWLDGYEGAKPVRVGNAASAQVQLDVYGEVLHALYVARKNGLHSDPAEWSLECALIDHLEEMWREPDYGIWEIRGEPRHFVHSKAMAWCAFDRIIRSAEEFGLDGPVERWRATRDAIHDDVCAHGFNEALNAFVQSYGSTALDAACLLLPLIGFLPADDPRVRGTVEAIEAGLIEDGFVRRYHTQEGADGLPPGEGAFLPCSFWLVDALVLIGRADEAKVLFERLIKLTNDVGLLAEEYDPRTKRQMGNFPQALSHVALINSANNLSQVFQPGMTGGGGNDTSTAAR